MSPDPLGFVLPVDKPVGPTSHDAVARARRALRERRIGHTGTLDPFASGLLLLCVGRATRIAEYLTGLDKSYEATARLGVTTTTDDLEGEVLETSERVSDLTESDVREALGRFVGPLDQVPPQYSAKKVEGEAMHRRARRGEQVALEPCRVHIYDLELVALELPTVRFRVRCSSGTYVRALARDLGIALGVGGHLTELRRTSVGAFEVTGAVPLDRLEDQDEVAAARLTPLQALAHLPSWAVDDDEARRLAHGQRVPYDGPATAEALTVVAGGGLLAIARAEDGVLKPAKVFA